jgi:hypothetical protein
VCGTSPTISGTSGSNAPVVLQRKPHLRAILDHVDDRNWVTEPSSRLTAKGVSVTETSSDPLLTDAIRKLAQEVSGFVRDGMPAMMGR